MKAEEVKHPEVVALNIRSEARSSLPVATSDRFGIQGHVSPGFEAVREAFVENFVRRRELGGACCAYQRGEKVVDLWGGIRNKQTREPWEQDTMVVVHSATKGLAAMTLALAHSRGWLDYEERVARYWPEFAQQGKEKITVRQLLAHQAGLFAFDEPVDRSVVADLDRLAVVLARQKPAWEPGTRQAYHAITLGFYEGELLRRVDPRHRSLGQFFQDEIATPLGEDVYIRLPEQIPNSRLATLSPPTPAPHADWIPASIDVGKHESSFEHLPGAGDESGLRGVSGRGARVCAQSRSAVRWRRRHRAGHRARLRRLRNWRTGAGAASGDAGLAGRPRDSSHRVGFTTNV